MNDSLESFGARLKASRKELGMTLRDLATETGLSATFLSTLERGVANPTLDSLRKVSNALGVPIFRLTENGSPPRRVVRLNERRRITGPPSRVQYDILTPSMTKKMVVFQVRATAEDGNLVAQPLSEPTEECLIVLAGQVRICVDGHSYDLETGDSIYFEGRDLESIHVIGADGATYISVITPPVF